MVIRAIESGKMMKLKKELEFHAKMFKEESDFLSINEDLLELRNEISDFKGIDSYFSKNRTLTIINPKDFVSLRFYCVKFQCFFFLS